jgi:tetratricopeptide (TPR) repeat protein
MMQDSAVAPGFSPACAALKGGATYVALYSGQLSYMPNHFWRKEVIQPALHCDVEAAAAEQQSILADDPHNANACFALGTLLHFQGATEPASQYFQKSIELDSGNAAPHRRPGRIYALRGEYEQAWKHARAAEALGARDLVEMLERYPEKKGDRH